MSEEKTRKAREKKSVVVLEMKEHTDGSFYWQDCDAFESTDHAREWLMENAKPDTLYRICTVQHEVKLTVQSFEKRQLEKSIMMPF